MSSSLVNSTLSLVQNMTEHKPHHHWVSLVTIYSAVLVSGTIGVGLMVHIFKSSMRSVTTIAVINLIFAHLIFLLTVPFRIYFYATGSWKLGEEMCKIVSGMIHVHMYMCFLFYTVILVIRLQTYRRRSDRMQFGRKLHAFVASVVMWVLVLVVVPCVIKFAYGQANKHGGFPPKMPAEHDSLSDKQCFNYGDRLKEIGPKLFNYFVSSVIILVACVLTSMHCFLLALLTRKYGRDCSSQQEFWAQLKSLCFVLVMLVCYVPYQLFRLYYLVNVSLEEENEVFLSLTALSCFDMLIFMGRGPCYACEKVQVA